MNMVAETADANRNFRRNAVELITVRKTPLFQELEVHVLGSKPLTRFDASLSLFEKAQDFGNAMAPA